MANWKDPALLLGLANTGGIAATFIYLLKYIQDLQRQITELNNKHDNENIDIRLTIFAQAIIDFEELLNKKINDNESVFHNFLKENQFLLDFYGVPI